MSQSVRCYSTVAPIATALALLSSLQAALAQPLPDKPPPPSTPPRANPFWLNRPQPICGRIDPTTTRMSCLQVIAREQLQLREYQEQHRRGTLSDDTYVELTAHMKAHIDEDRKTMLSLRNSKREP